MTRQQEYFCSQSPWNAGTQRSFLDECWELAYPRGAGTQRYAGTRPAAEHSRVAERTQRGQVRWKAHEMGVSGLRSRVPEEPAEESNKSVEHADWPNCARKLLATCPDADLRSDLSDFYEETAANLDYEQNRLRHRAEMLAYGLLLFEILRRGIDAKTAGP